ncbi:hypothetical protein [Dehalococcoides mccartyi]|uniref:hypothetical protein n=1 Tax=Dehalococcoides mccartyi TaxID=61435 RepID=UPI00398B1503
MGFLKSNFTIIAENTTKYYLELRSRYSDRFDNDTSLLAISGILDAQNYIFTSHPIISTDRIFKLASDTIKNDESLTSIKSIKARIWFEKRTRHSTNGNLLRGFLLEDEESNNEDTEIINTLFTFIFGLELMIFRADSPKLSPYLIEEACRDKYKTIEKAIVQTMNKHKVGQGIIAKATTNFIESPKFQQIRQKLGIIESKRYIWE